ncbi:MAG: ribonuclease HI [Anaerolineaceae bacterium]|nr:ribonuclease HI [Anaerolineaceae bacterium]
MTDHHQESRAVKIYTDGGCRPNPGPGAWAAILRSANHERILSGRSEECTTNNRMELRAVIEALKALGPASRVTIVTDSQYVKQGITEWLAKWEKNNWRGANRKPIKNQELWRTLAAAAAQHQVTWEWVAGHIGDEHNERAHDIVMNELAKHHLNHAESVTGKHMKFARRVAGFNTTIFQEINDLARESQATNLGQGRPDFDGPFQAIDAAIAAFDTSAGTTNQYAPGPGVPLLMEKVAEHAADFYGLSVDPAAGVLITAGATQAIFSAVMGLVDAGDEVIVIEPYYDSYVPSILMAGATPIYVPLRPPQWTYDREEMRAVFSRRPRAILLNTPHNPVGRVYTLEELSFIADLCKEFDVLVITDEVYEHLTFDSHVHIPIATLPDMFERTITIGSAGKTFGMTGWKIGWSYGPPDLIQGIWRVHQFVVFAVNHPTQLAVAHAFGLDQSYYRQYRDLLAGKREILIQALDQAGLTCLIPEGTYFVMADFSNVFPGNDIDFARHLAKEIGVACIPPSVFYSEPHKAIAAKQARFAFCKNDETLHEAAEKLARLAQH